MNRSTSRCLFFGPRVLIALLLCAAAGSSLVSGTPLAVFYPEAPTKGAKRTLTVAERVAYQRAIEDVFWRHRIWPNDGDRPNPKPSLDAVMSQAQLENKVADYLRKSQALEDYWQRPITAEQLQAELDRMAKNTRQPEVLRELFAVLGNDPFVIAECLARPALAERLLTDWYAYDERIHGELRQRAEAELQAYPTIEQVKQTSGTYSEIELVKSDDDEIGVDRGASPTVKLASREWDETVQKLAATFGESAAESYQSIPVGKLSSLQEDEVHYYATTVMEKADGYLKLGTIAWPKEAVQSWMSRTQREIPSSIELTNSAYTIPTISDDVASCTDNTWAATSLNTPIGRISHTAIWTGTEMIIWGGGVGYPSTPFNSGGRYSPSTDVWITTTRVNAPFPRGGHTAVWTGSEMIVWGGGWRNSGGRYNPITDSWTRTSNTNAPTGRSGHTAVWTGTQMIVWGGYSGVLGFLNTGGRYNPNTNSWTATSTTNAPAPRDYHTVVWTGGQMIVWGGETENLVPLNTGGRYNPSANSWTAMTTTNAPIARELHTAVWTGSQMIVWGGYDPNFGYFNTGGRYSPTTNSWTATNTSNAPTGRYYHTSVWTGSKMIVWGGQSASPGFVNTGGRYNPGTNSWTTTSVTNAPARRWAHTAVWSGSEMIVWGGEGNGSPGALSTGGRYNPATNTWATTNGNAPTGRRFHTAVWTGDEMIVWGGDDGLGSLFNVNTGGRYNPSTDSWAATSILNAPAHRSYHTAIWTGTEMIVFGGWVDNVGNVNTGGRYNPHTNSWAAISTINAPTGRSGHTAMWTGTQMIVWGGSDGSGHALNTGGKYNPTANSWTATNRTNAPSARIGHTAVWTDSEMVVWGGSPDGSTYLNTGGRYNPGTNSWTATNTANAPVARSGYAVVWSGSEMIVWGGFLVFGSDTYYLNSGGKYDPTANIWTATSTTNAPSARGLPTAIWNGNKLIVWGGFDHTGYPNRGGRYNPATNTWTPTSTAGNVPIGRYFHTAVWTGTEMIVWGGLGPFGFAYLDSGGRYCAQ